MTPMESLMARSTAHLDVRLETSEYAALQHAAAAAGLDLATWSRTVLFAAAGLKISPRRRSGWPKGRARKRTGPAGAVGA